MERRSCGSGVGTSVGAGTRTGVGVVIGTGGVVGCGVEACAGVISLGEVDVASGDGADWLQPPRKIASSARQRMLTRSFLVTVLAYQTYTTRGS